MSVESILALGRRRREALMRSTCRIERPGGEPVWNPTTGEYTPAARTVIYEGICRIKPTFSPAERDGSSADRELVTQSYGLELPWADSNAADAVDTADIVIVTSGDDTWLNGKELPVGWVDYADTSTHRQITVWTQERGATNG